VLDSVVDEVVGSVEVEDVVVSSLPSSSEATTRSAAPSPRTAAIRIPSTTFIPLDMPSRGGSSP
jgi:hypothetical protein